MNKGFSNILIAIVVAIFVVGIGGGALFFANVHNETPKITLESPFKLPVPSLQQENEEVLPKIKQIETILQPEQLLKLPIPSLQQANEEVLPEVKQREAIPQSEQLPQGHIQQNQPTQESSVALDICANALLNGGEIISGPSGPDGADSDNPFQSLTIHPTDSNHIFVGTERNGFLRSRDGGVTWERLRYGLRHDGVGYPEIYDIAIAQSNPDILYAATVDSPGPLTGIHNSASGVYKSTDGGQTWERKNCGIQDNGGRTTGVYIDPLDANHVFIAISGGEISYFTQDTPGGQYIDGGIYETTDGGNQWVRLSVAPNDSKNELRYFRSASFNPNLLYMFGATFNDDLDIGLVRSTDNGKTWQQIAPTIRNKGIGNFDISADGMVLYVHADDFLIYKSIDGGTTWTSHRIFTSGYTVTVSPQDSSRVLYGQVDGLYLSTNGLLTVTKVLDIDQDAGRISDLVFAPSDPTVVYMITGGYIIYKSIDSGATFVQLGNLRNNVLNKDL